MGIEEIYKNPIELKNRKYDYVKFLREKGEEYKNCKEPTERQRLRRELVDLYTEFTVPALSLAIGTLISFPGAFAFFYISLQISGRGLPDIQNLVASFPPAADALSKLDPALGNIAVAAVAVELVSPLLILFAAALKGQIETALRARLESLGLDAESVARKIDEIDD